MHEDFHCLDLRERATLVLEQGELLLSTNFYGASVKLFHVQKQYIEMYHHPVTRNIMRVSVATADDLDKHLKKIKMQI